MQNLLRVYGPKGKQFSLKDTGDENMWFRVHHDVAVCKSCGWRHSIYTLNADDKCCFCQNEAGVPDREPTNTPAGFTGVSFDDHSILNFDNVPVLVGAS